MFFNTKPALSAIVFSSVISFTSLPAFADNLIEVYHQAVANDAIFKQAQADWLAAQQDIPIARSYLLPNISLAAGAFENYQNFTTDASFTHNGSYASTSVNLTILQPIFNWKVWASLRSARAGVKAATANYYYAQQDLITRTVQAYLNVLQADDILRLTRANKAALAEEYDTAKRKYDVGLARITDVYDAQAQYDQARAKEIAQVNTLQVSIEALHQITGQYYHYLDGLSDKGIPLSAPQPNDIEIWAQTASKQNYQLQAQYYSTIAAKEQVQVEAANFYPSFGIQGSFSDQRQFDRTLTLTDPPHNENLVQQLSAIGLGVNWDIFQGGNVVASTRQARYQYASSSAKEQTVSQQVVAGARKAFLGVNSYNAQIRADQLSVKSAQSALESSRAGYNVGYRTLTDVLNDTTLLYQSEQALAVDQYAYINNFVALKELAGTLGPADVVKLNSWLTKPINLEADEKITTDGNTKEPRQPTTSTAETTLPNTK
ncbi:MAG: TolC family outer membrane protein [Proteobacteria bacterium]|nr:TolC family outer membrane protein [Pseudomonadota bacterium]